MSITIEDLMAAAQKKKYRKAEGFLDNAPVFKIELDADNEEFVNEVAPIIAERAGVSLEFAEAVIMEEYLRKFGRQAMTELINQRNN
jgi:hypothetical protein